MVADDQHENSRDTSGCTFQDAAMSDEEVSSKLKSIKKHFMERTKDYGVPQLERLYTRLMKDDKSNFFM
nr:ATPase family AAA domain-containing protein At1g05910 isoform X1 [Ipomoea batatas]